MSSDIQSTVELLWINDYTSLILITVVVYDYLLILSKEVEYVWRKPWTWVSTMFVLVRYVGLCWAVLNGIVGSTFVPSSQMVGAVMRLVAAWQFPIFFNAADLVMILRVYAMWNRSKRILATLLFVYIPQVIISFIFVGIYDSPMRHLSVSVAQAADLTYCKDLWRGLPPHANMYDELPRFILGGALLVLAMFRAVRQTVLMYKVNKQWKISRCMELLMKDGILYFLVNAVFNLAYVFQPGFTITTDNTWMNLLNLFCNITMCFMMPRFIISVRELYDPNRPGIDTGFGALPSRESTSVSSITFVRDGVARTRDLEEVGETSEVIPLDILRDNSRRA